MCWEHASGMNDDKLVNRDFCLDRRLVCAVKKTKEVNRRWIRVGTLIVHSFGDVVATDKFYNENVIFPKGFKSVRRFWSTKRKGRADYHCIISEKDQSPLFTIVPLEDEG